MNAKRGRNCLIVLAVVALAYVLVRLFAIEFFALAWHVRHGRTAELKSNQGHKYEVEVPLLAWARIDEDEREVWMVERGGPFRSYFSNPSLAFMTFSVDRERWTADKLRAGSAILKEKAQALGKDPIEVTVSDIRTLTVAGEDLHCFEHRFASRKDDASTLRPDTVDLTCVSRTNQRGFSASYMGTRGMVPKFFAVLETARRVHR